MKMRVFLFISTLSLPFSAAFAAHDDHQPLSCSLAAQQPKGEVSQSYDMPTFIASLENADRTNKGYISREEAQRHRVIQERMHLLDLSNDGEVTPKEVAFFIKYRVNETTKKVFDELSLDYSDRITYDMAQRKLQLTPDKVRAWDQGDKGFLDFKDIYIQRALPYAMALSDR